jgi:hypothetical protein
MSGIQIPKGQNPLRLPFASFRLIFGLEKTEGLQTAVRLLRFGESPPTLPTIAAHLQ